MKYKGKSVNLILNKHPFTESLIPLLPEFEKLTGITTKYLILPEAEYFQKTLVDLTSGAGEYDVFMTGPYDHWKFDGAGQTEPLDPFMKNKDMTGPDYQMEDIFPSLIAANTWNKKLMEGVGQGNLWAVPVMLETYVQAYRKDIYDEKGLKPAKTIEQWRENNKKATSGDIKGIIVRGLRNGGTSGTGFLSAAMGYGGTVFDADWKPAINSEAWVHVGEVYCASVKESGPPGWTNVTWYEGQEGFASGKYGQYYDCEFFAALYEDPTKSKVAGKTGYAVGVAPEGKDPASSMWTWALAMSSKAKSKEASWYFIQWATMKEQMTTATVKGRNYMPTRKSVLDNPDVQKEMGKWGNGTFVPTFLDNVSKYARLGWPPQSVVTTAGVRIDVAMQETWSGEKTAKKAFDDAAALLADDCKKAGLVKK
jgi:multiple sugar transport system substrate-binding protein